MKAQLFGDKHIEPVYPELWRTGEQNVRPELLRRMRQKGSSTLEILIAFAVLTLSMTAIILVGFSNQSVAVDSQTNNEALYRAQSLLEVARAQSRKDFFSIVSTTTIATSTIAFTQTLTVEDVTQCKKNALSTVSWFLSPVRTQTITLATYLIDIAGALALGGDCDTVGPGNWDNPQTATSVGLGGQGATGIDARGKFVYLTSNPSATAKEDFFVYEFDQTTLTLTERGKINVSKGLGGIDTAQGYAYTLNDDTTKHLIVIDVNIPTSPTLVASSTLPNMTAGIGRSIFYYDEKVYIGTQYLACPPSCPSIQNNEFHVYDVSTPTAPVWLGSANVNHNINAITVRGDYAYLATSDNNDEVYIYDVSNPATMTEMGSFNMTGNEDATSLYLIGNRLYVGRGRTPAGRSDFYVLDILDPAAPTALGSKNLGLNPGAIVVGVVVRGPLAFLAIDDPNVGFNILNVSNLSAIVNHTVCTPLNFSENTTAMDMDGDFVFTANSANDEMRVIRDQPTACTP